MPNVTQLVGDGAGLWAEAGRLQSPAFDPCIVVWDTQAHPTVDTQAP